MQKWIIIGVIILIVILTGIIAFNTTIETEYIPEEEISSLELRKTMVNLYYKNKETKEIQAESRLIDSKELLKEPYHKLIQFLIDGPERDDLEKIIPNDVKIVDINIDKHTLKIKFTKNILINNEIEPAIVDSITKTLTQLNEVQNVIIEVDAAIDEKIENVNKLDYNSIKENNVNTYLIKNQVS